jgi:hypothetical protein
MIKYFCDRCEQEAKDICKECLTVNDCVKEECKWHWIIEALEKQIPKKPRVTVASHNMEYQNANLIRNFKESDNNG